MDVEQQAAEVAAHRWAEHSLDRLLRFAAVLGLAAAALLILGALRGELADAG